MYATFKYTTMLNIQAGNSSPILSKFEMKKRIDKFLCVANEHCECLEYFGCESIRRKLIKSVSKHYYDISITILGIVSAGVPDNGIDDPISGVHYTFDNYARENIESVSEPLSKIFCAAIKSLPYDISAVKIHLFRGPNISEDEFTKYQNSAYIKARRVFKAKRVHTYDAPNYIDTFNYDNLCTNSASNSSITLQKLREMPGLNEAKDVLNQITASAAIEKERRKRGMTPSKHCWHMAFLGEPGTAKTTFAKGIAGVLYDAGIVHENKLSILSRADLVGGYIGESESKTKEILEKGKGGIIFIDEAYSLVGDERDFGPIVINQIIAFMEEHRTDTVFIFAGYPDKMEVFLNLNEGLRSRIMFHVHFQNYSNEELWEIINLLANEQNIIIKQDCKHRIIKSFDILRNGPGFGNGRSARNLLEQAINQQRIRLYNSGNYSKLSDQELSTLLPEDFKLPLNDISSVRGRIGFTSIAA